MEDLVETTNNRWRQCNVLVTGCTGLLGSWLTAQLIDKGANVVGLVRDNVGYSCLYSLVSARQLVQVTGQLEDYALLERVLNEYEVECVFHLAAQTQVGLANRGPIGTFEANIRGTYNLLEAVRRSPWVKHMIVASSDKAYGAQAQLPYDEEMPLIGRHPYDVSKSCADLLAQAYFHTYGTPVCITRCGNLYGGGDLNFNRIVPHTIRAFLSGQPVIVRSDGTPTRDYFYVKDAAFAYLHLAGCMQEQELSGQAFNFSNDNPLSVLAVVNSVLKVMGAEDHPVEVLNQAKHEIPHQYLSSAKARRLLNWRPEFGLEQGFKGNRGVVPPLF